MEGGTVINEPCSAVLEGEPELGLMRSGNGWVGPVAKPDLGWPASEAARQAFYRNITSTTCLVCGEKAITWFYGAASCKPCHRFFRRISQKIALKGGSISRIDSILRCCLTGGKCRMEGEKERARCTLCRYRRCVAVGMRYRRQGIPAAGMLSDWNEGFRRLESEKGSGDGKPTGPRTVPRPSVIQWSPRNRFPSSSEERGRKEEHPSPPPSSPESLSTTSSHLNSSPPLLHRPSPSFSYSDPEYSP